MKKQIIIPCDCGGHHNLTFRIYDKESDTWISMINADNHAPFFKRIAEAVRYVFGKEICYHDVVISSEDKKKLLDFLSGNSQ